MLGGVSALLQDRKRAGTTGLAYLGTLGDVALYGDERQLRRLSYLEAPADRMSYQVRVSAMPVAA